MKNEKAEKLRSDLKLLIKKNGYKRTLQAIADIFDAMAQDAYDQGLKTSEGAAMKNALPMATASSMLFDASLIMDKVDRRNEVYADIFRFVMDFSKPVSKLKLVKG